MAGTGLELVAVDACAPVDLGLGAATAPDEIGLEADEGVAVAHAALDGFEEERVGAPVGELEHGADGRVEIGGERRPHDLGGTTSVGLGEGVEGGSYAHEPTRLETTRSSISTP